MGCFDPLESPCSILHLHSLGAGREKVYFATVVRQEKYGGSKVAILKDWLQVKRHARVRDCLWHWPDAPATRTMQSHGRAGAGCGDDSGL